MTKKPEQRLKQYLSELEKINKERIRLIIKVSATKKMLVDKRNYVGILYIIRFLDCTDRDRLFAGFLSRHPEDFLFVMAFADSESSSYEEAEEIAETAYEEDIYAIKDDMMKEKDRILCLFLDEYNNKEDLQYVYDMIESCDWMTAYKKVVSDLINKVG